MNTGKCSVKLNFSRKTVPSSRTLPRETTSSSGVGDSSTAEIQLCLVFCFLYFIWEGTTFFWGGGGRGRGPAYEKPYLNWPKEIQRSVVGTSLPADVLWGSFVTHSRTSAGRQCWDPFDYLYGQCRMFSDQIRFDRVQTFYSVSSNMFPCATDHDAGTYYPHSKKKAQVWNMSLFGGDPLARE